MNVQEALIWAETKIALNPDSSISESAKVDAEFILSFCLEKNFTWLKTWPEKQLEENQQAKFKLLVSRRAKGEPVAYITGSKAFWTLELETNESTLIPRAETEALVELALESIKNITSANVLDLGTGTGAIALSIASERPKDNVVGCDFNAEAVALAKRNAVKNQINNASFIQSDWFKNVPLQEFQLIVSNPPYVAEGDPHLQKGDLVFEPDSALISSGDGLDDIRIIAKESHSYLVDNGILMIEHGFKQGESVREILLENNYHEVETKQDLLGHDRVTLGRKRIR